MKCIYIYTVFCTLYEKEILLNVERIMILNGYGICKAMNVLKDLYCHESFASISQSGKGDEKTLKGLESLVIYTDICTYLLPIHIILLTAL